MGIPDHLTFLQRNLYADEEQQLELDKEQQTGSKSGKEYIKAVYCHSAYLTYMQSMTYDIQPSISYEARIKIARRKYQ